ncbi:MAG: hypothetical protein OXK81_10955 [Chloroflexota bacterium]|nr:hypothetical protein [Chloroflexota bacterium]MDE2930208.1 hypothetical protein [Chloroflexota bacterium]
MSQLNRLQRNAIVLSLAGELRAAESWCGETHLQKAVYLLQELTEVPLGFDFILYKHGPFSFDLRDALIAMRADYQLRHLIHPIPYGPSLVATDTGKKLQERFSSVIGKYRKQVTFVAKQLGSKSVTELERIGTALYVQRENEPMTVDQNARRVNELKPHVSLDLAKAAAEQVDEMVAAHGSSD